MSIWAPVIAALGASLLTGFFGFGAVWWQQHRLSKAAEIQEKSLAYHLLISRSLSFVVRATTLRNVMKTRSGLKEGVDVTFRFRKPSDPMELHDWLSKDFEPINEAWSKIQMIGAEESIDSATQLLDACGDLIGIATTPGTGRGKVATTVKGIAWTSEQEEALQAAIKRVTRCRESFVKVARRELGKSAVALPLEKASNETESDGSLAADGKTSTSV
jgi:hypothetical protein